MNRLWAFLNRWGGLPLILLAVLFGAIGVALTPGPTYHLISVTTVDGSTLRMDFTSITTEPFSYASEVGVTITDLHEAFADKETADARATTLSNSEIVFKGDPVEVRLYVNGKYVRSVTPGRPQLSPTEVPANI